MLKKYADSLEFTTLSEEMNPADAILLNQASTGVIKRQTYRDLRRRFVSATVDNTAIGALVQLLTNKKIKYGSGGEVEQYYDGTNFRFNTLEAVQQSKFSMNNSEFLILNAAAGAIAVKKPMNYTGAINNRGISFDPTNNNLQIIGWPMQLLSAGIAAGNMYTMGPDGSLLKGLKFPDNTGKGLFLQGLEVTSLLKALSTFQSVGLATFDGNIKIDGGYISSTGTNSGIRFSPNLFSSTLDCSFPGVSCAGLTASAQSQFNALTVFNANIKLQGIRTISYTGLDAKGLSITVQDNVQVYQNLLIDGSVSGGSSATFADFVRGNVLRLNSNSGIPAAVPNNVVLYTIGTNDLYLIFPGGQKFKVSSSSVP